MNSFSGSRLEINKNSWDNVLDKSVLEYVVHIQLKEFNDELSDSDLNILREGVLRFFHYLVEFIDYRYILTILPEWHKLDFLEQVALSIKIVGDYNASFFMNVMDYLAYNKYIKGK